MDWLAGKAVCHPYTEWGQAIPIVGLLCEETYRGGNKSIVGLLGGQIGLVAGQTCPPKCGGVYGVMTRRYADLRESGPHVIADLT